MFDFDLDLDWKSVAIGAGAVAAVVGAAYGISKLCEDDSSSSTHSAPSFRKQKTPDEVLSNVDMMNKVINSDMPLELATDIAAKFNFSIPKNVGRTTALIVIFNSNNDEMIKAVIAKFNEWEKSNGKDVKPEDSQTNKNNTTTKEASTVKINLDDVKLMDEIIDSNMPASLIKAAGAEVGMTFTTECRKEMIKLLFMNGAESIAAIKKQYEKWKNKEFSKKDTDSQTNENEEDKKNK